MRVWCIHRGIAAEVIRFFSSVGVFYATLACNAFAVLAQEMPRSGKVELQITHMQFESHDLDLDHNSSAGSLEYAGVTREIEGSGWFDQLSMRCTGQYYRARNNPPASNGACLYSNLLGDRLLVTWRETAPLAGVQRILGGTGRFAGISGQGTYTSTKLHSPTVGLEFWLTDVELEYQRER
jgi:hypothetical protein